MTENQFANITEKLWRIHQREKRLMAAAKKLTVPTTRRSRAQAGRIYKALSANGKQMHAALDQLTEALYASWAIPPRKK